MQGKVCVVTGATNGIGKVTALELAKLGATVVVVGRSAEKTAAVVEELKTASGGDVRSALADLSVQAQVRALAETLLRDYDRIDVLVNNAGGFFNKRVETEDGIELTFALNHLSYFLLTILLLDRLRASAPARVVNVSSDAHRTGRINFDDLEGRKRYVGFGAYAQSKLANILFSNALARRLEGSGVTSNALHPGAVATGFGRNNGGLLGGIFGLLAPFMLTPEKGARSSIYLASSPEVEGVTGRYYGSNCQPSTPSAIALDIDTQERLWSISLAMTGLTEAQPKTMETGS